MSDRLELEERVARYLHRTDITAEDYNTAIAIATSEIGRDLRAEANEYFLSVAAGSLTQPYPLPDGFREMRSIEVAVYGGWATLSAGTRAQVNQFAQSGGLPARYVVMAGELFLRPFQAVETQLWYWGEPEALSLPADSNAVLERHFNLYLYRVSAEICLIAQDLELTEGYLGLFDKHVGRINASSAQSRLGDSPAMVGF